MTLLYSSVCPETTLPSTLQGSWSSLPRSKSGIERALNAQANFVDTEIDIRLLKLGAKVAWGSCGDLHRGVYVGQEVAVKVLRSETLNEALEDEFRHEVAILRDQRE